MQALLARYEHNSEDAGEKQNVLFRVFPAFSHHALPALELVQLMVYAAGNPTELAADDIENVDVEALTERLTPDDIAAKYPLANEKNFAEQFGNFWLKLVLQSGDVLFDEYLLGHLTIWIELLSNLEVRNMRHVGTTVGLQLITGLIQLHKKNSKLIEAAATNSGKSKKSKVAPESDKLTALAETIESLFQSVFVVRYRDVWDLLRGMCIASLGSWIELGYQSMIETKYVKYLGWALYDPKSAVRLEAVRSLAEIYSVPANVAHLEKFTGRFQDRMGALPDDKDANVAVAGIRLCSVLAQEGKLKDEHLSHVYQLLVERHPLIRTAAGEFTMANYFGGENDDDDDDDLDDEQDSAASLRKLVAFVLNDEVLVAHSVEHIVRALWPDAKGAAWLRDFESMFALLLLDKDGQLEEVEQALLGRIAVAVVTVANEDKEKVKKPILNNFSQTFSKSVHLLLKRYKADAPVVRSLVRLVKEMDPEHFSLNHVAANHQKTVRLLADIFADQSDAGLAKDTMSALVHLSDPKYSLAAEARKSLNQAGERVVKAFSAAHGQVAEDNQDDNALFALAGAVMRLSTATRMIDLGLSAEHFVLLKQTVDERINGAAWPTDDMTKYAVEAEVTDIMWALHRLLKGGASNKDELEIKRDDVLFHLEKLMSADDSSCAILSMAIRCTADLLNLFSGYLKRHDLERLSVRCSSSLSTTVMDCFHKLMDSPDGGGSSNDKDDSGENDDDQDDGEDAATSSSSSTNDDEGKVSVLESICQAIKIRSLPTVCASHVLVHFGAKSAGGDAGKLVVKDLLHALRKEADAVGKGENEYKMIFGALKLAFERFRATPEYDDDRRVLRCLAVALLRTYGVMPSATHKKSMVLLMQEATPYALAQGDAGFVFLKECILPFTSRMPQPELILEYFEKQQLPDQDTEDNADFQDFRDHLRKLANPSEFKTPAPKRSKKDASSTSSKKKKVNPKMQLQFEEEDENSEQKGTPQPSSDGVDDKDDGDEDNEMEESEEKPKSKKKRGRPKKDASVSKSTVSKSSSSSEKKKKKRGRRVLAEHNEFDEDE